MKNEFQLPLPALLYFVKESCHESLHETVNDLRTLASEIEESPITKFVREFIRNIQRHLAIEENTFFPALHRGHALIDHLIDDHEQMRIDLLHLRRLTKNYENDEEEGSILNIFFEKLREMDRIILNHIQIEDHILFPMVRQSS